MEFFLLSPDSAPELTERRRALGDLERLTVTRDFRSVVDFAPALLEKNWCDEDETLIHYYLGQAYCRLVRPTDALKHLPVAREQFERIGNEWMAVEALDWESTAMGFL